MGTELKLDPQTVITDALADSSTAAILPVDSESVSETCSLRLVKQPRRILHFSDGILEEYSTDEEDAKDTVDKDTLPLVDPQTLNWVPFVWYYMVFASMKTLNACDYMGEYLASLFGITTAKYQYEIDEYMWQQKQQEEEEKKENETDFWKKADDLELTNCDTVDLQPLPEHDEKQRHSM